MMQDVFVIVSPYLINTRMYYVSNQIFDFDVNEARIFRVESEASRHLNRLQTIDRELMARIDINPDQLVIDQVRVDVEPGLYFSIT
jgi:hypothetical protein